MQKFFFVFILLFSISSFPNTVFCQIKKNKPTKVVQTSEEIERDKRNERIRAEARYKAPIRYVVIQRFREYEYKLGDDKRRLDILIDEKQFNEKNLIAIFSLLKKRFPSPMMLNITVHTNIATIETPEEDELQGDGRRLETEKLKYRMATFSRFWNGREAFIYWTKEGKEKVVVLVDKNIMEKP